MYQTRKLLVIAVTTMLVGCLATNAHAAYPPPTGPSPNFPQQAQATQAKPGISQANYAQSPYGYGQAPYGYNPQQQPLQVPQQQQPVQWPATAPTQAAPQQQAYAPAQSYPRVAQSPTVAAPAPTGYVAPAASGPQTMAGNVGSGYPASGSYPASGNYGTYDSGCNTCNSTDTYASTGCADYGNYSAGDYGCSDCMVPVPSSRQWFVGIYGLYMDRDDSARVTTSMTLDNTGLTYPYYPPASGPAILREYTTDDVAFDFQAGGEIRFGSTFGSIGGGYGASCGAGGCASSNCGGCDTSCGYGAASCDGYGGGCGYGASGGCGPMPYAWEVAYWAIANDENSNLVTDTVATVSPNTRMYTTIDYRGIEFDRDGTGATYAYRPLTDYVGTTPPIAAPVNATDPVPVAFRTRTNFSMQNLELNMLKLPICGGISTCGIGCGGCGSCGVGCDGCGGTGCGDCFQPSYSITGVCGVRYVRFDDDFFFDMQFASPAAPLDGGYDGFYAGAPETEFFHQINVDNHLTGFQMGANMDWALSPCWSLFCNSQFGVFNNHMKHYQRVFENGAGNIRFNGSTGDVTVSTSKDDIAFMGELRCGAAYQISCNCRLTAAWRAMALSGVALSTNHINPFTNTATLGRIDSQGSLILHGLQVGSEFKF